MTHNEWCRRWEDRGGKPQLLVRPDGFEPPTFRSGGIRPFNHVRCLVSLIYNTQLLFVIITVTIESVARLDRMPRAFGCTQLLRQSYTSAKLGARARSSAG